MQNVMLTIVNYINVYDFQVFCNIIYIVLWLYICLKLLASFTCMVNIIATASPLINNLSC